MNTRQYETAEYESAVVDIRAHPGANIWIVTTTCYKTEDSEPVEFGLDQVQEPHEYAEELAALLLDVAESVTIVDQGNEWRFIKRERHGQD